MSELRPAFRRADADQDPLSAAYHKGHAAGRSEALAEAERGFAEELRRVREELTGQLESQAAAFARQIDECQRAMVALALEAASSMLRQRIEAGDPVAARALEQALAALPDALHLRVRLHPEDRESVLAHLSRAIDGRGAELVADASVERGGCLVETESAGCVDATVGTAEETLREAVGVLETVP